MIFGEGLFQADGHPGNILIGKGGRVGLLDYGQSKQLPDKDREAFARLVLALTRCGVVGGGEVRGRTSLKVGGDQGRGVRAEGIRVSTLEK